eukprot:6198887-Pleurochrysis_carterae.AAC.1
MHALQIASLFRCSRKIAVTRPPAHGVLVLLKVRTGWARFARCFSRACLSCRQDVARALAQLEGGAELVRRDGDACTHLSAVKVQAPQGVQRR